MASGEFRLTEASLVGKYEEPRSTLELLRFRHPSCREAVPSSCRSPMSSSLCAARQGWRLGPLSESVCRASRLLLRIARRSLWLFACAASWKLWIEAKMFAAVGEGRASFGSDRCVWFRRSPHGLQGKQPA
jgi:hypothetical protein